MSTPEQYVGLVLEDGSKLIRVIGTGQFAWVYEARTVAGERVAIKVLARKDGQGLERFFREIKVMQELPNHPNRVGYRAHGKTASGGPWLAMEMVDGFTLRSVLQAGKPIPAQTACMLMGQLCEGFNGLHTLGMAHRDITPANIMVTHKGRQVKLMDFGLVQDSQGILKLFEQASVLEGDDFAIDLDSGFIAGTPEYMAPEQISDPHEQDSARQRTDTTADVFALGAIFFELVAGRQLFPYAIGAGGVTDRRQAMINYLDWRSGLTADDYNPPDALDAELWSIIRKALQPNPDNRQRNAKELGEDIRFYVQTGQGVLEDDLSQTVAAAVEVTGPGSKRKRVALNTMEFQTLRRAAQDTEESAAPHPEMIVPTNHVGRVGPDAPLRGNRVEPAPQSDRPPKGMSPYIWLVAGIAILGAGIALALALAP